MPDDSIPGVREIRARDPGPAEAVEMADHIQRLMADMDEEEQEVLALKLEQHTNEQIGHRLQCSERTVRRILSRVQSHLRRLLEESTVV
jgi:RNA polymerase sigma factor (sigma-70 family)